MQKKERKIMVAVDDSEKSMYALSWCIANLIADTPNVKLVLFYVKPPSPDHSFNAAWYMISGNAISAMEEYGNDLANSVMERAEAICKNLNTANNIKTEKVVRCGDTKDVICSAAQKLEADTLVLGTHGYGFLKRYVPLTNLDVETHGYGFLKRALVGSVSDYCAKHVKCAVVIVKPPKKQLMSFSY